jgi:hypothetical protein
MELTCVSGVNLSSDLNTFELPALFVFAASGFLVVRILSVVSGLSAVCPPAKEKNLNVGLVWTNSDREFMFFLGKWAIDRLWVESMLL